MNRNKKLFANSVLHGLIFLMLAAIFLTLAAILDNSNTACEEAEKQKKNSDLDGSLHFDRRPEYRERSGRNRTTDVR